MPELVIDFVNATMHTSVTPDKTLPPQFVELRNFDLSQQGTLRKRLGSAEWGTSIPIGGASDRINAIFPLRRVVTNDAAQTVMAVSNTTLHQNDGVAGAWSSAKSGATIGASAYPWRFAWACNGADPAVLFANKAAGGAYSFDLLAGGGFLEMGSGAFTSGDSVEYFLNRAWVGNTNVRNDSLYWSITGSITDWTGTGSGTINVNLYGGGNTNEPQSITGLRVYRDRLYILTSVSLHVLTGRESATFGHNVLGLVNYGNGSTFWNVGELLYWVDRDGIWQFNGTQSRNIVPQRMRRSWDALSAPNDIDVASASFDENRGIYCVYFPTVKQMWVYYYRTDQLVIWEFASAAYVINVIGPPLQHGTVPSYIPMGSTATSAAYYLGAGTQDNAQAITAYLTTGQLSLAALAGEPNAEAAITDIWVDYVEQAAGAITFTMDLTIDGTAQTQQTLTIPDAGSSDDTFPSQARMPLPAQVSGRYFQFKFQDATDAVRCDIRKVLIRYEVEKR